MPENEIDYLNYAIINVVSPGEKVPSWQKELEKDFFFYCVSGFKKCLKILTNRKNIAVILCGQIEKDKKFWKEVKKNYPWITIFSFLSFDQFTHFKSSSSKKLLYHPLLLSSPPDILHVELAQALECYACKQEKGLLQTIKKQENWFSLIGQLTREWAHEIKNHIAIISLNAEISVVKAKKSSLPKPINLENIKKIIEQCQKISGVLDGIRGLSQTGLSGLPSFPLTETIRQAIFIVESEDSHNQTPIKNTLNTKLCLSYSESILLRSALINILRYFNQIKNNQTSVYISIQEKENAFCLKIQLKDIFNQTFPIIMDYVNGPINKIVRIERKKRDFYIGVRLIKSLGAEISLKKNEAKQVITLQALLPSIGSTQN